LQKLSPQEIQQRVTDWQNQLQLKPEWLEAPEIQLGVVERQLIAIARGLAMHPTILLLDNVFNLFDPARVQLILEVLQHAREAYNFTILLATHQLEIAKQWSQHAFYLEGGEIVEDVPAAGVDWQDWQERLTQTDADWE
jgi:ABC-type methionine transport system ATPase subunit